jgi:OPA family glycerol-3-phosphate transporter-like MFS transporter
MGNARTLRWQTVTLATLFAGYTGYYICRSNLSVMGPSLKEELAGSTFTDNPFGLLGSVGIFAYALGKTGNGVLGDFLGGRRMFLLGMVVSVACTVVFGLSSGLLTFVVVWGVNRYFQAMGWVGMVKVSSRWFPAHRQAFVMGVLSLSYLVGDAFARFYLGVFRDDVQLSWRGVFLVAAATLGVLAVVCAVLLKSSPGEVGAEEPPVYADNVYGRAGEASRPDSLAGLLLPLLGNLFFWLSCVVNFGLTLIRETFGLWLPTYLHEVGKLDEGVAAKWSALFPLAGAVSVVLVGVAGDRLRGKHGRIVLPCLVLLIAALGLLAVAPLDGRPAEALVIICAVGLFLLGPYSLFSGVIALQLGGKRGSSAASGLIDCAGYLGGTLSGVGVGALSQRHGWPAAFGGLAGIAALTAVAAAAYWVAQELRPPRAPDEPLPGAS